MFPYLFSAVLAVLFAFYVVMQERTQKAERSERQHLLHLIISERPVDAAILDRAVQAKPKSETAAATPSFHQQPIS